MPLKRSGRDACAGCMHPHSTARSRTWQTKGVHNTLSACGLVVQLVRSMRATQSRSALANLPTRPHPSLVILSKGRCAQHMTHVLHAAAATNSQHAWRCLLFLHPAPAAVSARSLLTTVSAALNHSCVRTPGGRAHAQPAHPLWSQACPLFPPAASGPRSLPPLLPQSNQPNKPQPTCH